MNTKKLKSIFAKFEGLKADLEEIHSKAQDTYDGRSEKWQESEKGQAEYERISNLESAMSDLENAMECLDNASVDDE
jgi:hypothetical protein